MNKKGFSTILAVFIIALVVLLFFTASSVLLTYRGKSYSRIKEAMNIINVMEEASKAVRASWDQGANIATTFYAPAVPTAAQIAGKMPPLALDATCTVDCQTIYGGATPVLCYPNPGGAHAYCLYGTQSLTTAKFELKVLDPEDLNKPSMFEKVQYVAGSFVDLLIRKTKFTFSIGENKAQAASRVDDVGMLPPACALGVPGCLTCGPLTGAICGMIYACPLAFNGCSTYTGGTNAVFAQEFYITPPGSVQ